MTCLQFIHRSSRLKKTTNQCIVSGIIVLVFKTFRVFMQETLLTSLVPSSLYNNK